MTKTTTYTVEMTKGIDIGWHVDDGKLVITSNVPMTPDLFAMVASPWLFKGADIKEVIVNGETVAKR